MTHSRQPFIEILHPDGNSVDELVRLHKQPPSAVEKTGPEQSQNQNHFNAAYHANRNRICLSSSFHAQLPFQKIGGRAQNQGNQI